MESADRSNQAMIDRGEDGPVSPEDLADEFRTQSYHLMERYPIAGAHLVLAAAALAPTCDHERDVADEFSYLLGDFAVELGRLHARAKALRMMETREVSHGNC